MRGSVREVSARLVGALYLMTLGMAAVEKFAGMQTPEWFTQQFSTTFLAALPGGLTLAFFGIAALEALAAGFFAAAIVSREPFKESRTLQVGLVLSQLLFMALGFGQRLTHKYDEASWLFVYAFVSFVLFELMCNRLPVAPRSRSR